MKESSTKVENAGAVISAGTNVGLAFSQLAQMPSKAFVPEYKFDVGQVTPDGFAVNTSYTVNSPHPKSQTDPTRLVPGQTMPTIGDRLSERGVS